jgi:hypothetical protein
MFVSSIGLGRLILERRAKGAYSKAAARHCFLLHQPFSKKQWPDSGFGWQAQNSTKTMDASI